MLLSSAYYDFYFSLMKFPYKFADQNCILYRINPYLIFF